jgi:hypothetical protein
VQLAPTQSIKKSEERGGPIRDRVLGVSEIEKFRPLIDPLVEMLETTYPEVDLLDHPLSAEQGRRSSCFFFEIGHAPSISGRGPEFAVGWRRGTKRSTRSSCGS